jgi:hypothetical protein
MTHLAPLAETPVTLGHLCDSRASRVPTPTPTPTKNVQQPAGLELWGEPERGPTCSAEPDAPRLDEEPRALRRGPHEFSDQEFRRFCKLARAEIAANPGLDGADLTEHLKCAAARAHLRYDASVLGRVLDVVQPRQRAVALRREPPRMHWRARCEQRGHPWCTTPTQCDLRAAKEDGR